ncbi:MAG: SRPBCC family protein [Bacteroidota bacterium]
MAVISLKTVIHARPEICFDLSRSIDLHQFTTRHTNERAIDGRTQGLIEDGEFVTWEATHFFLKQHMTVQIIAMQRPHYFKDEMVSGPFRSMTHTHTFDSSLQETVMLDHFHYTIPFGILGRLADFLFLKRYMQRLLERRNSIIKQLAESGEWKRFLKTA